jgi:hypothetical protein
MTANPNVDPYNLEPVEGAGRGGGVPPPDHLQEPVAGLLQQHVVVPLHPTQDGVASGRKGDRENIDLLQCFVFSSVGNPHGFGFGPPGSGSISQRYY